MKGSLLIGRSKLAMRSFVMLAACNGNQALIIGAMTAFLGEAGSTLACKHTASPPHFSMVGWRLEECVLRLQTVLCA